jgi:hypothetical protein
MDNRPYLGRFLGVRDLVIGTGLLLQGQNTAVRVRAWGIADALDGALILSVDFDFKAKGTEGTHKVTTFRATGSTGSLGFRED